MSSLSTPYHRDIQCIHTNCSSVVFVHGLTGNGETTWTHSNGKFLPDLIIKRYPSMRLMTFGYDANITEIWGVAGKNTLRDNGKSLAQAVSARITGQLSRPLIFIAHSLGGLVVEQALLICRGSHDRNLKTMLSSTIGILFMGTPHDGSHLASWGKTFARWLNIVHSTNSEIIAALETDPEVLLAVEQEF